MTRRLTTADIDATREALRAAGGKYSIAATALGTREGALRLRVWRRPDLWPQEIPASGLGRPKGTGFPTLPLADVEATRAALRAHGGIVARAAKALGISPQALHQRLETNPKAWPAGVERKRFPQRAWRP